MDTASFVRALPKAELHLHIEGTLEPEMMFKLAARNGIDLPYADVGEVRAAYEFSDLQSFLDIYYQGATVLVNDGVRRAEVFFDPQTHTERGVDFSVFMNGFTTAIEKARTQWGISAALIMCFLRHLSGDAAVATWLEAEPYLDRIIAVGLDSGEVGNPPERFVDAYRRARDAGLHAVAHAGEEGPPAYIVGALDTLGSERIDHGVRCTDDAALVERLANDQIPLTMCPLSNLKLRVFDELADHNLKALLDQGVLVTVNSDDPAYFGGYVLDNYVALADALNLSRSDLVTLAGNSIRASFIDDDEKAALLAELASAAGS